MKISERSAHTKAVEVRAWHATSSISCRTRDAGLPTTARFSLGGRLLAELVRRGNAVPGIPRRGDVRDRRRVAAGGSVPDLECHLAMVTEHEVDARTRLQEITPCTTQDDIVASPSANGVITTGIGVAGAKLLQNLTVKHDVAQISKDEIMTCTGINRVVPRAAKDNVIARAGNDRVVASGLGEFGTD